MNINTKLNIGERCWYLIECLHNGKLRNWSYEYLGIIIEVSVKKYDDELIIYYTGQTVSPSTSSMETGSIVQNNTISEKNMCFNTRNAAIEEMNIRNLLLKNGEALQ